MKILVSILAVLFVLKSFGQTTIPGFTDKRDGHTYTTLSLGNTTWMMTNLFYSTTGSWLFNNDSTETKLHGRLYTYEAALNACPAGWQLPSDEDWKELERAIGMPVAVADSVNARGGIGEAMTGTMKILFTGYRRPDGSFVRRGERAAFWSSTSHNEEDAWHRDMRPSVKTIYRSAVTKTYALSVRCIKNKQ